VYYVYYSFEEFGRGYIGSRCQKSVSDPQKDDYLGSFSDPTFRPTQKIILGVYETSAEALKAEILLHDFYDVAVNPHFANKAKQTSFKFSTVGTTVSKETRQKMSNSAKKAVESGQIRGGTMTGKKHSDETKQKMREASLGQKHTDETKQKMRKAKLGGKLTDEHKKKVAEWTLNRPRIQCPHCDKKIIDYKLPYHIKCRHPNEEI